MSRSKRERKIGETYYDLLNWVDAQLEVWPISLSELGLLFYILQACNKNYGNECLINLKVIAVKCMADVRRLPQKLQTLAQKGYINCAEVEPYVWQITVKRQTFASEQQGIASFSGAREEKKRQDNEEKNVDFDEKNVKCLSLAEHLEQRGLSLGPPKKSVVVTSAQQRKYLDSFDDERYQEYKAKLDAIENRK